ncbi:YadA-like family protein [Moraxella sp. ZJ142]|uniref:YadA-like family protein n=1 Tax=Moraxella marmotae TaxID=3344520 RepID=UPI0035D3DB68
MNKIFKTKRNALGQSVVCSEIAKSHGKGFKLTVSALAVAGAMWGGVVQAAVTSETTQTTSPAYFNINKGERLSEVTLGAGEDDARNGSFGVRVAKDYGYTIVDNKTANGAKEKATLAVGAYANAVSQGGIAIGNFAQAGRDNGKKGSSQAGRGAIAIGYGAEARGEESLAIGGSNHDAGLAAKALGEQSMAIGPNTIARGHSSIAIGNDDIFEAYAQPLSTNSSLNITRPNSSNYVITAGKIDETPVTVGDLFEALTGTTKKDNVEYASTETSHAAVALGVGSNALGELSTAFGTKAQVTTGSLAGVALGVGSRVDIANGVAIGAAANTYKRGTKEVSHAIHGTTYTFAGGQNTDAGDVVSFGAENYERQLKNVAAGQIAKNSTDAVNGSQLYAVLDGVKKIRYLSVNSTIGSEHLLTDADAIYDTDSDEVKAQKREVVKQKLIKQTQSNIDNKGALGNNSIAIGPNARTTGSLIVGDNADFLKLEKSSVLFTDGGDVADNAVALGANTTVSKTDGTAVGSSANVTVAGGVALGSNSVASVDKSVVGATPFDDGRTNKYTGLTGNALTSTLAAVSIGNGATITRQITGLAAGTNDTDAVNVAQLKSVNLKIAGNTGKGDVRLTDQTLAIEGNAAFIVSKAEGNKVTFDLSDDVKAKLNKPDSPSNPVEETVVAKDGEKNITVATKAVKNATGGNEFEVGLNKDVDLTADGSLKVGPVTINKDGIKAGDKKITNVAAGEINADSTDAVNGSQLYALENRLKNAAALDISDQLGDIAETEVVAGDNITVTSNTEGNKTTYTVSGPTLTGGKNVSIDNKKDPATGKVTSTINVDVPDEVEVVAGDNINVSSASKDGKTTFTVSGPSFVGGKNVTINNQKDPTTGKVTSTIDVDVPKTVDLVAGENIKIKADTKGDVTTYTISATVQATGGDGSASVSNGSDYVTVKAGEPDANGVIDYAVDLSDKAKSQLAKEESISALSDAVEVKQDKLNSTGGKNFGVDLSAKTKAEIAKKTSVGAGDGVTVTMGGKNATGGDIYNVALSDATKKQLAKEESVKAGSDTVVVAQDSVNSTGGKEFSVDLSDATKAQIAKETTAKAGSDAVVVQENTNSTGGKEYTLDLSDTAKARIAKEESVSAGSTSVVVKQSMTNSTGGKDFAVDLADVVKKQIAKEESVKAGSSNVKVVKDGVNATGGDNYTVDVANNLDLGDQGSVQTGDVMLSNGGLTINNGPAVTNMGINAGDMKVTHVAAGEISPSSTDAVNGSQLQAAYNYIGDNVNHLHGRINDLDNDFRAAMAGAHAAASLPEVRGLGKSRVSIGLGQYRNQSAVAVGYSRLSDNGKYALKAHISSDTQKNFGGGIGLGYEW